jgi:hypothetical protein
LLGGVRVIDLALVQVMGEAAEAEQGGDDDDDDERDFILQGASL